ncbi:hypothetical protein Vretimale_1510 [Volvox reticuliferus]|uniref:Uncharacterized protein n=1 Tax=Volvox reticuliferus TaxID=1737510 RepID=A0A8J4FYB3_9CHLO|nr:hypothetical protein Vretimale_1510 [Volvox reticuliferus]
MGQALTTLPVSGPISPSASNTINTTYFGHTNAIQLPCGRNHEGPGIGLAGILHGTSNRGSRESDVFGISYTRRICCCPSSKHFNNDFLSGAAHEEHKASSTTGPLTLSNIPTNLARSPDRKHEADQSLQMPTSSQVPTLPYPLPPSASGARQGAITKRSGRPRGSVRVRPTGMSSSSGSRCGAAAQGKAWSLARQSGSKNSGWGQVSTADRRRSLGTDASMAHSALMMPQNIIHTYAAPTELAAAMTMVVVDHSPHEFPPMLPLLPPLYNFGSLPLRGRQHWEAVAGQALSGGLDLLSATVPIRDSINPFMGPGRVAATMATADAVHEMRLAEVQAGASLQPLPYSLESLTLNERLYWDAVIVEVLTEDLDAAHATVTLRTGTSRYGGMCGEAAAAINDVKVREALPALPRTYDLGSLTRSVRLCWEGLVGAVVG